MPYINVEPERVTPRAIGMPGKKIGHPAIVLGRISMPRHVTMASMSMRSPGRSWHRGKPIHRGRDIK
jgi:hypothetical protein